MPAPFTRDLCGYRESNGKPNMSDAHDTQSVRLGARFLDVIGVDRSHLRPDQDGLTFERHIIERLQIARPDLKITNSGAASDFSQYQHLKVFPDFRASYDRSTDSMTEMTELIVRLPDGADRRRLARTAAKLSDGIDANLQLVDSLIGLMPEESLLKVDVVVGVPQPDGELPELAIALSAKWSLRTDRAQDCVSQGNKLVTQRRGRMPHFGVITAETRPSMLRILADGSGAVDWVYHLDLDSLAKAVDLEAQTARNPDTWSPKKTFDRLIGQKRLRDFDDLVRAVEALPG
ncbi:NgoMIV family type II restriction endonuclease [Amycolatopsis sp. H20-H5]|uniref:NgoMIV family type II restriction endonuclease n=1 Tax=Amycolatopsis sp. H20-H5 TaxID=3046309 RepID=UPI002DBBD9DB|nr:NgoMIV family type II restriction endonuclease [Amycolatopsis sp. H20-H5]MEC3979839.1 NgoMIV family type II restriction endonuclease [Amycolatopsis sp. H20-H5]